MIEPSGSTDWSAAYAHYLLRAAQQTARTQSLSYLVLQRVSRGELSPATLRDALTAFAERRGGDYGTRVANASARFFSGLVQIAVGARTPPPPPYDPADPYGWYQRLTAYAADLQQRSLNAYREQLERAARGDGSASVAEEYTRRAHEQVEALGRLYFELLETIGAIGAAGEEEFLRTVLANAPADRDAPVVELTAPLGASASAVVSLENTRTDPAVIRCLVTDVRRADGIGPSFVPEIVVDPDGLMLDPEQEGSVRLSLTLDAAIYTAGADYVGAVQVLRHGEPRLDLPLHIRAAAPPAADAS
jgi:hypothetical protein